MNARYGWVVVGAGALMSCVAIGAAMFSLAVFLDPLSTDTGWSRAGISRSAMTLNFIVMGLGGLRLGLGQRSPWHAHRGAHRCALLLGAALVLASQAGDPHQFQLAYSGSSSAWRRRLLRPDDRHRDTDGSNEAQPRHRAGVGRHGVAPLTSRHSPAGSSPPMTGVSPCLLGIGGALVMLMPAALFVRGRRHPLAPQAARTSPRQVRHPLGPQALRSPQFVVLGAHHLPAVPPIRARSSNGDLCHHCGLPPMAAVNVFSVDGLAGLGGRILCGVGRPARRQTDPGRGAAVQAIAIGLCLPSDGSASSTRWRRLRRRIWRRDAALAMSAREYFGQAIMGRVFGAATMGRASAWLSAHGPAAGSTGRLAAISGFIPGRSASGWGPRRSP